METCFIFILFYQEDDSSKTEEAVQETEEGSPKKNGTLAGIASAAASNAASVAAVQTRVHTSGIIVQFPEMFSLKRDRHILDKFSNSLDVRMQK